MSETDTPRADNRVRVRDHADSEVTEIDRAKVRVAKRLMREHRGKANAVSSRELAEGVSVKATTVRDLIPEIMAEFGIPIGTANGYFVIEDKDEYARQVDRQLEQAKTSKQRAKLISATFNRRASDE